MNNNLSVTLFQQNLFWENIEANISKFAALINSSGLITDILVLPEMFSTGFSMQPEKFSQTMDGSAISAMKAWARACNAAVCGSLIISEKGKYYNRFVWVEPDGKLTYYDKGHLFRMGEEQLHYSKGNNRIIIDYKGWKIAPFICYDLRFPVWLRRSTAYNYDLILLVANWPEKRSLHWKTLTQARAIENQSYLVAVNRVGIDGNQVNHSGDSQVIKPTGDIIFTEAHNETVKTLKLNFDDLTQYRTNFPVGMDADIFELNN
ncbi:MAG: amidohydrolase [Bacteroidota bacterium]|nr:amidohydrolase [Bacteroidota bacterium]